MRTSLVRAALVAGLATLASCDGPPVSRELGARCDVTSDCAERCLAPSGDYPGGFCTTSCTTDQDCAVTARCADRQGGVCLFACAANPDCAFLGTGWRCREADAPRGGKVTVCRGD